ncbi:MAG TPA: hypothetical protein VGV38_08085, partial [Pyrinomonadaceae bacterium]|nr:hypothetical protein [Pyrinomonadaceae bacterium]
MQSATNFLLLCAAALALSLACARAGDTHTANAGPSPATDEAATSELFEPTLDADAQGDDALAAARSADRNNRAPDGALAQMSPAEHMRRAGVYHANRA